ncbi:type IV pili methyl-accepting chemotaxis transducer N-terminal domain-containing protein [uncultured Arcobacter sp.]|uniref:type IV pili methyl-accepting chemotaxis transducer N-terminal domain-containing protein n=1 Tax=uncultured Arcobacter sp. TaxID=165434 RepID=UPI0026049955|nr:type IV pili methyl-accepting chemotaxis transducer N-terminal domain-containing protein [uncultured Arcobacter sp.]
MKTNKISTKIKTLGALFIILMAVIIFTTVYLNNKNKKDALVINIVGKERMLTQKISKNIFYLYYSEKTNFSELNSASEEFIQGLDSLKNGNKLTGIEPVPNDKIGQQLYKVEILWKDFFDNVTSFKKLQIKNDEESEKLLKTVVETIYNTNNNLLNEVDELVTLYTLHAEDKTVLIKNFQYLAAVLILLLIFYAFTQLKGIEENANKFLEFSKKIANEKNEQLETLSIDVNEKEILEVTDTFNCFINKINSAMNESAVAMEHSKNASSKLEEITNEFDNVINDLKNRTDIGNQLNKSEDMVIESTEDLINSTKKLQDLKEELDKILHTCKL